MPTATARRPPTGRRSTRFERNPLWYKDAIIYQLHVRAFFDSNGDGIGDFVGLAQKLDYLQELGVTALWLLPFYPSPLKDDGYDIADYNDVHPSYGTLADFKLFLREAHARGLRVITELVINHTSDQHPWFQRARRAPAGSTHRDFYVWTSDPEHRYAEARIIFKDFESSNWTWDPVAGAYFWHRFYSHQPDLNFENPEVMRAVKRALDFWLGLGVDGLRLDAVPYLFERDGTSCENLPETHAALRELRAHVDESWQDRMLLAEANQWPEDAVAYFGAGDECHMAFHFPLMPRMFMAVRMEDRYPVIDILSQTPEIPASCQWATFLRNHDELTLEMVTDEERDYMYRVYASDAQARINLGIRRRLAPLLGNDRRKIELMNGLLFSMPGTPVVYYGDEIGMGDNIYLGDRNGVRTPMQWSADRNAGFSRANPQRLFLPVVIDPPYAYESLNVETERDDPYSLLWWLRRLVALRTQFRAFGSGSLEFLQAASRKVLTFVRTYEDEVILVVANLSRHVQYVEVDLSAYKDRVPVELLGQSEFPRIGELPYLLTLGPYAFYWFALEQRAPAGHDVDAPDGQPASPPRLSVKGRWDTVFRGRARTSLEKTLPAFLRSRRWFGGKARQIKGVVIDDAVPMAQEGTRAYVLLLRVEYAEGDPDHYLLTLTHDSGDQVPAIREQVGRGVVALLDVDGEEGVLYGATWDRDFNTALLQAFARRRRFKGERGELAAVPTAAFRTLAGPDVDTLVPAVLGREQSNTSIKYGEQLMLKLFRRAEAGLNPDVEISSYLTEAGFAHVPRVAGTLQYRPQKGEDVTLGILQAFVPNEGDAWEFTLDSVGRYYERVLALPADHAPDVPTEGLVALAEAPIPEQARDLVATYLDSARLLGQRTAELHLVLARGEGPGFAPEPFTPFYQRSLYQSMRNLTVEVFERLAQRRGSVPAPFQADAARVSTLEPAVLRQFRAIADRKLRAMRTRHHGDYHLGQVLWTGRDFMIIDFEGEPTRALSTRRIKRSPLRDVAGMLRSFDYAAHAGLATATARGLSRPSSPQSGLDVWARYWVSWVSAAFLGAYLETAADGVFVPDDTEQLDTILTIYLLEKVVYELGYELNNRPAWVYLPLQAILRLVGQPAQAREATE
jgi:maltose alpha-D-glucosyltransferase/alpha-amylase